MGTCFSKKHSLDASTAEMARKSSYSLKIEEDYEKNISSILAIKLAIEAFTSSNMAKMLTFVKYVEEHLECLTDERQVLLRCEEFPFEKLEALRMAVGRYKQLKDIISALEGWILTAPAAKIPLPDQLDKIECYFNEIVHKVIVIERNKDNNLKRFESQNITFDYRIITEVKKAMVDLSSRCIDMVIKGIYDAKEAQHAVKLGVDIPNMLWRIYEFASRVYSFAGSEDARAYALMAELAEEIKIYMDDNIAYFANES